MHNKLKVDLNSSKKTSMYFFIKVVGLNIYIYEYSSLLHTLKLFLLFNFNSVEISLRIVMAHPTKNRPTKYHRGFFASKHIFFYKKNTKLQPYHRLYDIE